MRQQATPSRSRTNAPATTGQEAPRAAGVHQHYVDWLLDPRLVEARLRWHQGLLSIAGISEHMHELEAMWQRLSHMSEQNSLLAKMTGILQARRVAAVASYELRDTLRRAEQALAIHWGGFMKTAAEMLAAWPLDVAGTSVPAKGKDHKEDKEHKKEVEGTGRRDSTSATSGQEATLVTQEAKCAQEIENGQARKDYAGAAAAQAELTQQAGETAEYSDDLDEYSAEQK